MSVKTLHQDIQDASGWKSLSQFFNVLNSSINYVVLRGAESFFCSSSRKQPLTVDILVDDYYTALCIVNGTYSISVDCPHCHVRIADKEYQFNFLSRRALYFDPVWMERMFRNSIEKEFVHVLDEENYFYALVYHCLINKGEISAEDEVVLSAYCQKHTIEPNYANLLKDYLVLHDYAITKTNEKSVELHIPEALMEYAENKGILVKSLIPPKGDNFKSLVYEKKDSFIKCGSKSLIANEVKALKQVCGHKYFPQLLSYDAGHNSFEMKRVPGINPLEFFREHKKNKTIRSFINQSLNILETLVWCDIVHRDFLPSNFLVTPMADDTCKVYLIDFGWAVSIAQLHDVYRPYDLGGRYAPKDHSSDLYSLGRIIKEMWPLKPYVDRVCNILCSTDENTYDNRQQLFSVIRRAKVHATKRMILRDTEFYIAEPFRELYVYFFRHLSILRKLRYFLYNRYSI